jgi:hypothetical protein
MKTVVRLFDDLVEIELDVEYKATYTAARIYGPMDDCYPAEGELELIAWPVVSKTYFCDLSDVPEITQGMIDEEVHSRYERIVDDCWDDFHSRAFERAIEKAEWEEDR